MGIKDGLFAIANEVLGDVQKDAEAIILSAENQSKETLKAQREQAIQKYLALINQATSKAEDEKRKIASVTEVEVRNRLLQTKEDIVETTFEKALEELKDYVTTEEYHTYLLSLIKDVAKSMEYKNLVVQVNAKDKAWLTQDTLDRLSKKQYFKLTLSEQTEDFIGGCKILTQDGKITNDNTIDNRLKELKPALRVEVAKILFEKEA